MLFPAPKKTKKGRIRVEFENLRKRNPPGIVLCVGFLFLPWLLIDPHGSCGTGTVC
jgi:hypothetical protein